MSLKVRRIALVCLFIVTIIGAVFLGWLEKITDQTSVSVFYDNHEAINDGLWKISYFRPVYLITYKWAKQSFILGVYKDDKKKINFIRLLVGCQTSNCVLTYAPLMQGKTVIWPKNLGDYKKYLKFGKQFNIAFIHSGKDLSNNSFPICINNSQPCQVASLTDKKITSIGNFKTNHDLSLNDYLPVLFINVDVLLQP